LWEPFRKNSPSPKLELGREMQVSSDVVVEDRVSISRHPEDKNQSPGLGLEEKVLQLKTSMINDR